MPGKANWTFADYSDELSVVGITTRTATAANFDTILTELDDLGAALNALSTGVLRRRHFTAQINEISGLLPSDPYAQRERKWLVAMVDANGNRVTMEIPCADLDDPTVLAAGTDFADLTHANWVDFIAAIGTDKYVHAASGEFITAVTGARLVGRNI
jgi:hypothetical protein